MSALDDLQRHIDDQLSYTISKNRRAWFRAAELLKKYKDELARKPTAVSKDEAETIDMMHNLVRGR